MGILSKLKPAHSLAKFQNEIFRPKINNTIAITAENGIKLEYYEILASVWDSILGAAGLMNERCMLPEIQKEKGELPTLEGGMHVVKYFSIDDIEQGARMLELYLGILFVENIHRLPAFSKFDTWQMGMIQMQNADSGKRLDQAFQMQNPKSFDKFLLTYGYPPFDLYFRETPVTWMRRIKTSSC